MRNGAGNNGLNALAKLIIAVAVLILVIGIAFVTGFFIHKSFSDKEKKTRITSYQVAQRLEEASDLTTEKMIYSGVIHYEEGDIPFITKKSYSMTYKAEIEAGIDVGKIRVSDNGDKVIITLPDAEVQSVYVDPDSIEFHDEMFALFNWDSKQDGVDAVKRAENDARDHADMDTLTSQADERAKELIRKLFEEAINDQEVEVR